MLDVYRWIELSEGHQRRYPLPSHVLIMRYIRLVHPTKKSHRGGKLYTIL